MSFTALGGSQASKVVELPGFQGQLCLVLTVTGKIKNRLLRELTAVFRERELVTTLTLKAMFHQVNSNLSTSVSVNLDYLLIAAVEKRELVEK